MSTREMSFGARVQRGLKMMEYLNQLTTYQSPREEESIASLTQLVQGLVLKNDAVAQQNALYTEAVDLRLNAFYEDPNCADKLAGKVIAALEALLGKNHVKTLEIKQVYRKLVGNRKIKKTMNTTGELGQKTINSYQTSFGSRVQYFSDIVSKLNLVPNYAPSNADLSIENLQNKILELRALTQQVDAAAIGLQIVRLERKALYIDLQGRSTRVKAYLKSEYGTQSVEYKNVLGLKF